MEKISFIKRNHYDTPHINEKKELDEKDQFDEDMNVTMDKLRRRGSLSGWQKALYRFIVVKLGNNYLEKVCNYIYDYLADQDLAETASDEELVEIVQIALMDYAKAFITGDNSGLEI